MRMRPLIIASIAVAVVAVAGAVWVGYSPTENANTATVNNTELVTVVKVYLVAVDDGGQQGRPIGCNDSLVPVEQFAPESEKLETAIGQLLVYRTGADDGLYTALADSDLVMDRAEVVDGKAMVDLSGSVQLGGTCDGPRFVEQVRQTVLDAAGTETAEITVNGKPLDEVASLKGE